MAGSSDSTSATFSWNTQNFLDGTHRIEARAYDAANNVGVRTIDVQVKNSSAVDTIAPLVAITSPAAGTKVENSVKIAVSSSDNVGVTRVQLYIDGKLFGENMSATTTFTWNTRKVAKGTHILRAYAFDAAGNIGASSEVKVTK